MKYQKILIVSLLALFISLSGSVPEVHAKGSEICRDINDAFGGTQVLDCGQEDIVSFIGFEGGLKAPTGEGLDPTLTRAKTAKEFIKNTLNFVLSFLAIIAVAVVIYGGFLYVTAAGNEEASSKGKKSITYAAIGILIIIGSFALVNTLLTFGGGSGAGDGQAGTGRGAGKEGSNIEQQTIYNLAALEINASLNDFVAAYQNLKSIDGLVKKMKALPAPTQREENRAYVLEVINVVTEIKNKTHSLSKTSIAAQRMLNEYLEPLAALPEKELTGAKYEPDADLERSLLERDVNQKALGTFKLLDASKEDFKNAIDTLIGSSASPIQNRPTQVEVKGRLPLVWKIMGPVADSANAGALTKEALDRGLITEKDLRRAFAGIDPNITVSDVFKEAIKKIHDARALAQKPDQPDLIVEAVKALDRLYIVVKDLKFVSVKIKATVQEGNAPLIVELSGLDSRDPAARTIKDDRYVWDPDGDGIEGLSSGSSVTCNTVKGPTINCTYNQAGTFVVRLSVTSEDPSRIASGIAFFSITVQPSVARITLKANAGPMTEELRKYIQDAKGQWKLVLDKNQYQATTKEATGDGITFDASESKGGGGEPMENFRWTFGDNTPELNGKDKDKIKHKYAREGEYSLTLEVTDRGNRKDRKIVGVTVGSIAARIGAPKTIGEPDELMEFDGGLSRSDHGGITSYKWNILNQKGEEIADLQNDVQLTGNTSTPTLRVKFKKPGSYTIKLTASDNARTASTEIPISIKSRKPKASLSVRSCMQSCPDPAQPSLVEFDASQSFDPDPADILTYQWAFFNQVGDKLEPATQFTLLNNMPLIGKESKKLRVKFPAVGKYKVLLRINDSHTDPAILQEDTKEKEFEIKSIVEASWESINSVVKLENGKAKVEWKGNVRNAARVVMDFGNGQGAEQGIELKDGVGSFQFEHTYDKAGSFLTKLRAYSEDTKGENIILKRVYVSAGESPLAVMEVSIDGISIEQDEKNPSGLEIIRNKIIKFDAGRSVNSKGEANGLNFSWDFGDQKRNTGEKAEHSYQDISPVERPFTVILTVTEKEDPSKTSQALFPIKIISKKPQMNTLSLEKKTPGQTTPIEVELTAEGAKDPDGSIKNFQFWYYDPAEKERKLSVIDTQTNRALLTVETQGEENEEHEYFFCTSLTDNENTSSECHEMFQENELPKLKVKNGPNKPPIASFTVDRTSGKVGEAFTFSSSSRDPDGKIVKYVWDIDGDGFHNDNPTTLSSITHEYQKKSQSSGYRVKLKVIDDKGAAGYSKETLIRVDAKSNAPEAKFTFQVQASPVRQVKFFDNSTADTANGARIIKWKWDFDTSSEPPLCLSAQKPSYCNADKADDIESTDQNPIHDYSQNGTFQVKLTAEDSDANTSEKTAFVNIVPGVSGGTETLTTVSNILKAQLRTDPVYRFENKAGQQKKVIRLPANSRGQPITLFWGDSTGDIISYKIDKNIYCDSNGDGNRANDIDNPDTTHGQCQSASSGAQAEQCWTTNYQRFAKTGHPKGPGNFTTLLTALDREGKPSTDQVEIIFEGPTDPTEVIPVGCDGTKESLLTGSLFKKLGASNTVILSLISGVTVVLLGFGVASYVKSGKKRV